MRVQRFVYSKYNWNIVVYYGVDATNELDVSIMLTSLKANRKQKRYAINTIKHYNQGFTCSNYRLRTSFVSISKTTSKEEFINTIAHEAKHVVDDICTANDMNYTGEPPAYMLGELMMIMFKVFRKYLCTC